MQKFIFKFKIFAQLCKYVNYIFKKKPLKSPPMCFSYGYSSPERKKKKTRELDFDEMADRGHLRY